MIPVTVTVTFLHHIHREICGVYIPKNTRKSTALVLRMFCSWRKQHNKRVEEKCIRICCKCFELILNCWLSRFVEEPHQRTEGRILRHLLTTFLLGSTATVSRAGESCPNFMDRKDPSFRNLTGTLQVRYRQLRQSGVGAIVMHAPVVTAAA